MDGALPLWDSDAAFVAAMGRIAGLTLVDSVRCHVLWQLVRATDNVPGDLAEVGVYRGGTALLMASASGAPSKAVHLLDTFSGMPETAHPAMDMHRPGDFSDTSAQAVADLFAGDPRARLHAGLFPGSAERDGLGGLSFSLVHVDADIYRSVMDCSRWFYPRLRRGGVMVFDDYGFPSCPGARRAVDEYFAGKPDRPVYLPTGQCVVARLG